jgi:hypothetical protein
MRAILKRAPSEGLLKVKTQSGPRSGALGFARSKGRPGLGEYTQWPFVPGPAASKPQPASTLIVNSTASYRKWATMGRIRLRCFWKDRVLKYPSGIVNRKPSP